MLVQTLPQHASTPCGLPIKLNCTNRVRRLRQRRLMVRAEVGGGDKDIFDRYEKWRRDRRIKWRLWKFEMIDKWEAKKQELKETKFVVSWLKTLAYLRQKLDPVYRAWYWLMERFADFYFGYDDFLSEESKRLWKWSNTYELEINFWREAVFYFQHMVVTFIYLSFVPPSWFRGIILPLVCGYFMHEERLWTSPQAATVLLTAPLRYRPGCPIPFF